MRFPSLFVVQPCTACFASCKPAIHQTKENYTCWPEGSPSPPCVRPAALLPQGCTHRRVHLHANLGRCCLVVIALALHSRQLGGVLLQPSTHSITVQLGQGHRLHNAHVGGGIGMDEGKSTTAHDATGLHRERGEGGSSFSSGI